MQKRVSAPRYEQISYLGAGYPLSTMRPRPQRLFDLCIALMRRFQEGLSRLSAGTGRGCRDLGLRHPQGIQMNRPDCRRGGPSFAGAESLELPGTFVPLRGGLFPGLLGVSLSPIKKVALLGRIEVAVATMNSGSGHDGLLPPLIGHFLSG